VLGVSFDFLPKPTDVDVDDLRLAHILCPPYLGEQIIHGDNVSGMQSQRVEQGKLARG
jgi:hypothetical protein